MDDTTQTATTMVSLDTEPTIIMEDFELYESNVASNNYQPMSPHQMSPPYDMYKQHQAWIDLCDARGTTEYDTFRPTTSTYARHF